MADWLRDRMDRWHWGEGWRACCGFADRLFFVHIRFADSDAGATSGFVAVAGAL
jgi:hypothetical protein